MAAPLSIADRSRLEKIIGLLSSSFEPERLVALRKIQNIADEYKVPIHELLLGSASAGHGSSFDRQRAEQAERRAREAELRAQRAEQAARAQHPAEPPPDAPELPPDWRERLVEAGKLYATKPFLTNWEADFAASLLSRGTRWPSPKQAAKIHNILQKAKMFGTANAGAEWEDSI